MIVVGILCSCIGFVDFFYASSEIRVPVNVWWLNKNRAFFSKHIGRKSIYSEVVDVVVVRLHLK